MEYSDLRWGKVESVVITLACHNGTSTKYEDDVIFVSGTEQKKRLQRNLYRNISSIFLD